MLKNIIKKLRKFGVYLTLLAMAPSTKVYANDIFIGMRGPTNWQLDERVSYSNHKNLETIANHLIIKYWDGEDFGKWGFLSLPYKLVRSPEGSNHGLGDLSLGFGPRAKLGNLGLCPYGSLTFPTGTSTAEIPLGNGRLDTKLGFFATYLTSNQAFEMDGLLDYTFTGENKKNLNPPDEVFSALVLGGELADKLRFVTGANLLVKDNQDFLFNSRSVLRYTLSPMLHFEFIGDFGLRNRDIPKGYGLGFFTRYNF